MPIALLRALLRSVNGCCASVRFQSPCHALSIHGAISCRGDSGYRPSWGHSEAWRDMPASPQNRAVVTEAWQHARSKRRWALPASEGPQHLLVTMSCHDLTMPAAMHKPSSCSHTSATCLARAELLTQPLQGIGQLYSCKASQSIPEHRTHNSQPFNVPGKMQQPMLKFCRLARRVSMRFGQRTRSLRRACRILFGSPIGKRTVTNPAKGRESGFMRRRKSVLWKFEFLVLRSLGSGLVGIGVLRRWNDLDL